ncbi:unnamed protein product [Rotaria sp. Silwood2]|nr:unnamed protein product [Rotaria sp. Silwood2]
MSSTTAQAILNVVHHYIIYAFSIIFIAGLVGNICNIVIFISLKMFRKCPGAYYIIVESIFDLSFSIVGSALRASEEIFNLDSDRIRLLWCKLRFPIVQWCTLVFLSLVNFAVIDQYFSTNCNPLMRQLSTIKLAKYLTAMATLTSFFYMIPFTMFYDIKVTFGCLLTNINLVRYYSFFHLPILQGILPILLASTFSIMAYRNVRRIRRQQMSNTRRRLDQQLTAMILARMILFVVCLLPYTALCFYVLNMQSHNNQTLRSAIEVLILALAVAISYLNISVCHSTSYRDSFDLIHVY